MELEKKRVGIVEDKDKGVKITIEYDICKCQHLDNDMLPIIEDVLLACGFRFAGNLMFSEEA
jgi:hypothetical protein